MLSPSIVETPGEKGRNKIWEEDFVKRKKEKHFGRESTGIGAALMPSSEPLLPAESALKYPSTNKTVTFRRE